jgi:hypothetical protein
VSPAPPAQPHPRLLRARPVLALVALAASAASLAASEPRRLLFSDGTFRPCEILLVRDSGLDARVDGKVLFLSWDKLDPAQGLGLRAERLDGGRGVPSVRSRFELARDCLSLGFVEHGARQIRKISREHPLLAEVAAIWLEDFPSSEAAAALANGIDALLAGRWDDVYAPLKKAIGAPEGSAEQAASRKYLNVYFKSGGRGPAGESEEETDPALASQIRVIQGRMNSAWGKAEEAKRCASEGRITDMRRAFEESEALLDRTASECDALLRVLPVGHPRNEASDLRARAMRDLLELHLQRGASSLDLRLWTDADDAIGKVEKADPGNDRAKGLRDRLNKLWRKKPG